jgi:hypothetical protein
MLPTYGSKLNCFVDARFGLSFDCPSRFMPGGHFCILRVLLTTVHGAGHGNRLRSGA